MVDTLPAGGERRAEVQGAFLPHLATDVASGIAQVRLGGESGRRRGGVRGGRRR